MCKDVTEIVSAGPGGSKNNFASPKQILVLEEQDAMREIEAKRKAGAKKLLNGRKA